MIHLKVIFRSFGYHTPALTSIKICSSWSYGIAHITGDVQRVQRVMHPEDLADLIVAGLKLHPRVFLKTAGLWSKNP